jgi:hypothetical protein
LDIDPWRRRDDDWRVAVKLPVRCPVWPKGYDDARPDDDTRASKPM